jgi:hypothetical protein
VHNGLVTTRFLAVMCAAGTVVSAPARGDALGPERDRSASVKEIFRGPFQSSRLFAMPIADVVGAYQLTASGDGSLLQDTGILSFAGVLAIGFGDVAQLEYRHTAAISIENTAAPVPAVGVQLKLPLRERKYVPAFAAAFRLGVPRTEQFGATSVDETVTDLYLVSRLKLWGALDSTTAHVGVRVSSAKIEIAGDRAAVAEKYLVLPTGGFEVAATAKARFVAELALAPQFRYDVDDPDAVPEVSHGLLGRLGVRWWVIPALSIDGSIGYQLEVAGARPAEGLNDVVQWDIRLGGELFIPWGALACRAVGVFCERGGAP